MRSHRITLLLCIIFALTTARSSAEEMPTRSVRYLTMAADAIVVAEPIDPTLRESPLRFKVTRVLHGPARLAGQEIKVEVKGTYSGEHPWPFRVEGKDRQPLDVSEAMLFLNKSVDDTDGTRFRPILSGIRALTKGGELLVPQQMMNPGPQHFLPRKGASWKAMSDQVQADIPLANEIRRFGDMPVGAERNQAIFDWIEKHRGEFGPKGFRDEPKGLGPLEGDLFAWVMESCIPEDCWRAIVLAAELDSGSASNPPSFCSQDGRRLLLHKIFDDSTSESLRLRALRELGNGGNHWSSPRPPYTAAVITSAAEQKAIIEAIAPLIEHKEPNWRWTSVQTLLTVSRPYDANLKSLTSKQAIPALVAAYRVEENVHARSAMAEAIRRLEDEAFWQKLTRNPQGIVVTANFREVQRESLHFELSLQHTRAKITEVPQFHFVRMGVDVAQAESLTLEPQIIYPKNMFREGWESSRGGVHVAIPLAKVPPGRWQITVRGKIGEESWNADPIELKLPLPEKE